jgi:hypothetical protein
LRRRSKAVRGATRKRRFFREEDEKDAEDSSQRPAESSLFRVGSIIGIPRLINTSSLENKNA